MEQLEAFLAGSSVAALASASKSVDVFNRALAGAKAHRVEPRWPTEWYVKGCDVADCCEFQLCVFP